MRSTMMPVDPLGFLRELPAGGVAELHLSGPLVRKELRNQRPGADVG